METKIVAGRTVPVDPKLATDEEVMHVIRSMQQRDPADDPRLDGCFADGEAGRPARHLGDAIRERLADDLPA